MITCTYSQLDDMFETFDQMKHRAEDYVPTEKDMETILADLPKYLSFLIWIIETGEETEENETMRKVINRIIRNNMKTVEG